MLALTTLASPAHAGNKTLSTDTSGKPQMGTASYYGSKFNGATTAAGKPFNVDSDVAASKTLPLGTIAEVTNLKNGKTSTVKVVDRGPFRRGRVIDLSPKAASKLDLKKDGVAPVVVKPVAVPQPDGSTKLGTGSQTPGVTIPASRKEQVAAKVGG